MGLLGFLARISKVSRLRSAFPETLDGSRVPLLCFNRAQTAKRELEAEEEVEIKWEKEPQKKKKWLKKKQNNTDTWMSVNKQGYTVIREVYMTFHLF